MTATRKSTGTNKKTKRWLESFRGFIAESIVTQTATLLFYVGLAFARVLFVVFVAIGLIECALGALELLAVFGPSHGESAGGSDPSSRALALTLRGLEFLFLAPLPYVVLHSIEDFAWHLTPGYPSSRGEHEVAHSRLDEVKGYIISIMAAVIATDLVSRVLGSDPFTYDEAVPRILVFVALGGYFLFLRRSAS